MYQDLIKIGMEHRKSNIMQLPDIPKEFFAFFVRGYFDGDGCISWNFGYKRNYPSLRVLFSSGSVRFLTELAGTISKYLSISGGHIQKSDGASNLIFQGAEAMVILNYIYSDLNKAPSLKYKYGKYLNYKNNLMGPRVRKALAVSFGKGRGRSRLNGWSIPIHCRTKQIFWLDHRRLPEWVQGQRWMIRGDQ